MESGRVHCTVVLSSRENFVWHSMQEIIPAIERAWLGSADPGSHQVLCLDIDSLRLGEILPTLLKADTIVQTCFTYKMCRLGLLLRQRFQIDARWIIHLHNQATIACWPFHFWGMGEHLNADDVFISSCTRDAETMSLSFNNARAAVIPFTHPEQERANQDKQACKPQEPIPLVFIGRISAQKNLHTLLYALRLWLDSARPKRQVHLNLYGQEDHLGSPNMKMESRDYGNVLRDLVNILKLGPHVSFHGHVPRDELYARLSGQKQIFVSASLHSDENFGMAAFRALCDGNLAVLSEWGGHADFAKTFPEQVFFCMPLHSASGPLICARELAGSIDRAVDRYPRMTTPLFPEAYREHVVSARLRELAFLPQTPKLTLQMTEVAARILETRRKFAAENPASTQIFSSYSDPSAHSFFSYYGAKEPVRKTALARHRLFLVPWARITETGAILASDPHRGRILLKEALGGETCTVVDIFGKEHNMSTTAAQEALESGLLHD